MKVCQSNICVLVRPPTSPVAWRLRSEASRSFGKEHAQRIAASGIRTQKLR
jgi:hypothetical protein